MSEKTLVTGGCGYIGAVLVQELLAAGNEVRVLDSLVHGQHEVAVGQQRAGVEVLRGDVRDRETRGRALGGVRAVVHLAAIVGDEACARDPRLSDEVNVQATEAMIAEADAAGVERLVFASTCSNYGRMADPSVPIAEEGELRPVSPHAEQKVGMEELILGRRSIAAAPSCLRFATVYGVTSRVRFDLTVNEFTRELWAGRELEVFGERFWRPYIHVRDAARAALTVLKAPIERVSGEVFNAGRSGENYRKLDLVQEITSLIDRGSVTFTRRDEDPRDYKVSFQKIHARLGVDPFMTVPAGIGELISALDTGAFGDPFDGRYRNTPAQPRARR